MFGRMFVNKLPLLLMLAIVAILEIQILRISEPGIQRRQQRIENTVFPKHPVVEEEKDENTDEDENDEELSLQSEKNQFDDHSPFEKSVVFYNRVPKTASTSFMGVVYDLCEQNNFHSIHLNITKGQHVLSVADQFRLANNITSWKSHLPALYHGHIQYINFQKLGISSQKIFYINIIRKPLDRLVSYYYFLRFGDTFRPHKVRSRQGNKETFDECVENGHRDCKPEKLWIQIPFFCGHAPQCQSPGSRWALERAKRHLVENYLLVGLTEELSDFIAVLETILPRFFKGATKLFVEGDKSHLRKTQSKKPLKQETIEIFQKNKIWKMENDFYEFAKKVFYAERKRTLLQKKQNLVYSPVQFFYEKIRPK